MTAGSGVHPEGREHDDARAAGDRIASVPASGGVERLRAQLSGRAYARHRHDAYAVGVTDAGVQTFDYRGTTWTSLPGGVVVLHPDEPHDGRAGSDGGFAYRIVYIAPARIAEAVRSLCGAGRALPFLREPVSTNARLSRAVAEAFRTFPDAIEPLATDAVIEEIASALIAADPSMRRGRSRTLCDLGAVARVARFLEAESTRIVASAEIERVGGQDRFTLTRQFRQVHGTSPYRYLLMRRLDRVRADIAGGRALADTAVAAGFADQPHLTRAFKAAYGVPPGAFRAALRSRAVTAALSPTG